MGVSMFTKQWNLRMRTSSAKAFRTQGLKAVNVPAVQLLKATEKNHFIHLLFLFHKTALPWNDPRTSNRSYNAEQHLASKLKLQDQAERVIIELTWLHI